MPCELNWNDKQINSVLDWMLATKFSPKTLTKSRKFTSFYHQLIRKSGLILLFLKQTSSFTRKKLLYVVVPVHATEKSWSLFVPHGMDYVQIFKCIISSRIAQIKFNTSELQYCSYLYSYWMIYIVFEIVSIMNQVKLFPWH